MRHADSSLRAFTVVELLVVMFIITILVGMLLPALSSAVGLGHGTQCVSNLRQIGIAVQLYRTHNNDWFFPVGYPSRPNGVTSYFFGEVDAQHRIDTSKGYLVPYIEEAGTVDRCPSFREGDFRLRFREGSTWGYGYNYTYLGANGEAFSYVWGGQTVEVPRDMHAGHLVKKSTKTVLFADSARVNYYDGGATAANPVVEENFYLDPPSANYDSVHFRHNDRANVLFVGGNVEPFAAARWFVADGVDTQFGVTKKIGHIARDDTLFDRD